MANFTTELATDIVFPNINIYRIFQDGELAGYEARPVDGYVMYNTAANNIEIDENGNEVSVIYYYTYRSFPKTKDFTNFTWVAVPRDSVDENYIFGGGNNNDHEIM